MVMFVNYLYYYLYAHLTTASSRFGPARQTGTPFLCVNQNQTDIQVFEFRDVLPAILPSLRMLRERPPPRSHGQRLGRLWTYQAAAFRSGPSYARQVEQLVVVSGDDRRTGARSACVGPAPTGASLFGVMSDHKGRGLVYVGSDPIPPGAVVLEYTGTRYGSRDTPPNTAYLFSLEDGGTIDGTFYSGRSFPTARICFASMSPVFVAHLNRLGLPVLLIAAQKVPTSSVGSAVTPTVLSVFGSWRRARLNRTKSCSITTSKPLPAISPHGDCDGASAPTG